MKISTKTGDDGRTSLYQGSRVSKDDLRMEICGSLDELGSFIGLVKAESKDKKLKSLLELIQKDLVIICSCAATPALSQSRLKKEITKREVERIESLIQGLEKKAKKIKSFCLPGKSRISAYFDIVRVITRRVERRVVSAMSKKLIKNRHILVYLNRLSDLFFLLARKAK